MRDMISWLAQGVAMNYAKNVQLRTGNSALLCFAEPAAQQSHTGCRGWSCWGDGPAGVSAQTMTIHRFAVGSWTWATMPTAAEIGDPAIRIPRRTPGRSRAQKSLADESVRKLGGGAGAGPSRGSCWATAPNEFGILSLCTFLEPFRLSISITRASICGMWLVGYFPTRSDSKKPG